MEGVKKAHVQGQAPDFKSMALMPGGSFKELSLADYKGKYLVLFFYPLDFTFVCPTEITQFSDRVADFEEEGAAVVGCSIDSHFAHLAWSQTARSEGGIAGMQIPLLADVTHNICKSYGVQSEAGVALRGVFIIDGNQRVRSMIVNDLPVGRNVDEVLRIVKAFKYTDAHGDVMPCNWTPGSKTMKADPVKSQEYFSKVSGTKRGADVAQGTSKRNRN